MPSSTHSSAPASPSLSTTKASPSKTNARAAADQASIEPAHLAEFTAYTRLPLELRQQILRTLLFSLLDDTLRTWASADKAASTLALARRAGAPALATAEVSSHHPRISGAMGRTSDADADAGRAATETTNPLMDMLLQLSETSMGLRTDLRDPVKELSQHLVQRWQNLLSTSHKRLYEHLCSQIEQGGFEKWLRPQRRSTASSIAGTATGSGRPVKTIEEALEYHAYDLDIYYQQLATRILYDPSGQGGNGGGVLRVVARGWEGVFRVGWGLGVRLDEKESDRKKDVLGDGKEEVTGIDGSEEVFEEWWDSVFCRRLTVREVARRVRKQRT